MLFPPALFPLAVQPPPFCVPPETMALFPALLSWSFLSPKLGSCATAASFFFFFFSWLFSENLETRERIILPTKLIHVAGPTLRAHHRYFMFTAVMPRR